MPSDVGSPEKTLLRAFDVLADSGLSVVAISPFYMTPCFPAGAGPDYVNAAAVLSGLQDPKEMLKALHDVEATLGRTRETRWGQRTLDLDLIGVADLILPDLATYRDWCDLPLSDQIRRTPDQLILPHPRMQDRAFVLIPLADIAPDWIHPVSGLSVRQMLDALPEADKSAVRRL
jgi:2-amino-4-hydroxy-6-hydroxymethyldihydropteridine diphosphokinase